MIAPVLVATKTVADTAKNSTKTTPLRLRMLSVGPGDGELDLSFLAGVAETTGTGVDFVGLEPNANLRADFAKRLAADEATASGHTLIMRDEVFPRPAPESGSRSSSTSTRTQDDSYDVVLMGHVLYYFDGPDDTAAALRAALRSAGPNGRVVVVHQAGTHHISWANNVS